MALSKDEQHRRDEIERALRDDDAQSPARVTPHERRQRRLIASSAVTITGAVILLTGLVLMQGSMTFGVIIGVAGVLTIGSAAALFLLPLRRH